MLLGFHPVLLICLPGYDEPSEPSPNQSVRAYELDTNHPDQVFFFTFLVFFSFGPFGPLVPVVF